MSTSITFTVLPVRAAQGNFELSLYLSIKLDAADGQASTMAGFALGNWPAFISGLATIPLLVRSGAAGSPVQPVSATTTSRAQLDAGLWDLLFPPAHPVRSRDPSIHRERALATVQSYGQGAIQRQVLDVYREALTSSPHSTPSLSGSLPVLGNFVQNVTAALAPSQLAQSHARMRAPAAARTSKQLLETAFSDPIALEFHRAAVFFGFNGQLHNTAPITPAAPQPRDFHELLGHLGEFPFLLRKLGIVVDLAMPVPAGLVGSFSIQVDPAWQLDAQRVPSVITPTTACTFDGTVLRAASIDASSILADGMLRLDDAARFSVVQHDSDGTVQKLIQYAVKASAALAKDPSAALALPALRSGGLALSFADREQWLQDRFVRTSELAQDPQAATLRAEDLTKGYRFDVLSDGKWLPLCKRTGTVSIANQDNAAGGTLSYTVPDGDEGAPRSAAATVDDGLYSVHEQLMLWQGWSLVAPRPGAAVPEPAQPTWEPTTAYAMGEIVIYQDRRYQWSGPDSQSPVGPDSTPDKTAGWISSSPDPVRITSTIAAQPASLPRLRYGESYRFRARTVDLAGNSRPAIDSDAQHATPPVRFVRFEPVVSPTLVPRRPMAEGESNEHLVIRSDSDLSATAFASSHTSQVTGTNYFDTCERHVAPPKTSELTAELHGAIDSLIQSVGPKDTWVLISSKEAGSFNDLQVRDAQSGALVPTGRRIITPAGVPPGPAVIADGAPIPRGQALAPGQYVVHDVAQGSLPYLPYLPDPLASGAALAGVLPSGVETRAYTGSWPELRSFRFVLNEGADSPSIAQQSDAIVVSLPKATVLTVKYSSTLSDASLDVMALFDLLAPAEQTEELRSSARAGLVKLLTPARELTLVHAVQRPLSAPSFSSLSVWRIFSKPPMALEAWFGAPPMPMYATRVSFDDGTMLVLGGQDDGQNALASAAIFDPWQGSYTPVGSMQLARVSPAAWVLPSGQVLVADMPTSGLALVNPEVFDPATKAFSPLGDRLNTSGFLLLDGARNVAGPIAALQQRVVALLNCATGSMLIGLNEIFHKPGPLYTFPDGEQFLFTKVKDRDGGVVEFWRQVVDGKLVGSFDDAEVAVHALGLPMDAPTRTYALLNGEVHCDPHSSGTIDIEASWEEQLDVVSEPAPRSELHRGHAGSITVDYLASSPVSLVGSDGKMQRHEFGDTKFRRVTYCPVASTRFREYFAPAVTRDPANITLRGAATTVIVPNTAPPPAPRVLYAVPTFRWQTSADGTTRTRIGGGLRVYVDRPWFASGDGERLAVVEIAAGTDPIRAGQQTSGFAEGGYGLVATANDDAGAQTGALTMYGLTPFTAQGFAAPVVGYTGQFNPDRKLWYFDVNLSVILSGPDAYLRPAYFPFVKLGLARLQPWSIPGAHLSPIVTMDFHQIAADRSASVIVQNDGSWDITVAGWVETIAEAQVASGTESEFLPGAVASHRVTAGVESLAPGASDELGWTPLGDALELQSGIDPRTNSYVDNAKSSAAQTVYGSSYVYWKGSLLIDRSHLTPGTRLRLAIRETEQSTGSGDPQRLVYADHLPLS